MYHEHIDPNLTTAEEVEAAIQQLNLERLETSKAALDLNGMELRSKILFASLVTEYVANNFRAYYQGHGKPMRTDGFNGNIKYLVENGHIDDDTKKLMRNFNILRHKFIHEIDCTDVVKAVQYEPTTEPFLLELADQELNALPVKLEWSLEERLGLGFDVMVDQISIKCVEILDRELKSPSRRFVLQGDSR